ncbi:YihY/virulence factor BrkB family protein [Chryseosolibacter indicus]|uniref:YihY/virulence factor BrkB family protein n=1 Tax=Chryseosolibacter indicus TaxID=2782351 RepID=A0ABS5VKB9_9BACT|nr:YihY/virulence factor BrkB family protein [Chryseosolibacter indicus]MBT1701882.1 YihY/virulence factor BrkB family protein [Chryseosolibacter indicus]
MKLWRRIKNFVLLLKDTFIVFKERDPFNNSIIIAWYTIFSLPGLLVIIINLAGYFFGDEAVTNQLSTQIGGLVGGNTANDVQQMVAKASTNKGTVLSSILSAATLIFGATGIFYQLQQILNKMWEVKPKPKQAIVKLIRDRVFSFGLILVIGFLLLVSLVLSAALSAVSDWVASHLSDALVVVFRAADIVISLGIVTLLFASIYKFLPDAKIRWKDVWVGALLTSLLFVVAKFALGLYFGNSDPGSTYGAAGSVILIMLWVSYAGLILLFGAEFTKVYADTYGVKVEPVEGAVSTKGEDDNGAILNKKTSNQMKQQLNREHPESKTDLETERMKRKVDHSARARPVEKKTDKEVTEEQSQAALDAFHKAAGAVAAPFVYAKRKGRNKNRRSGGGNSNKSGNSGTSDNDKN